MSDSNNRRPNDEWIKSLYSSGKDSADAIPESIDAAILAKARQTQKKTATSRVQPYGWIYGTAASALLGILLIMQVPETDDLPSLLKEVEERQVQSSKFAATSRKEAPLDAEAKADVELIIPIAESIDEVVVTARRAFQKEEPEETPPENLLEQAALKAPSLSTLPAAGKSFSTFRDRGLSRCTRLIAYFINTGEKQAIEQCKTDTQLNFRFEKVSANACNEIFRFALESTATVSTRKRDSESGVEEIQIEHAGNLYFLHCDAGQWVLTQP